MTRTAADLGSEIRGRVSERTLANTDMWPPNKGVPFGETAFVQPEQLLEITDILLARGHSEADVRGILGENLVRVARQVWK